MNNKENEPCVYGRNQHEWTISTYRTKIPNGLSYFQEVQCQYCFQRKLTSVRYELQQALYRAGERCSLCEKEYYESGWFYQLKDPASNDVWIVCQECFKNYQ